MSLDRSPVSRRRFLTAAGATVAASALGGGRLFRAGAAAALVNPYNGRLPLQFPLAAGTYQSPLVDNWHDSREGAPYAWSHRLAKARRAHDGVDVFPSSTSLPAVFAPFAGTIAALAVDGQYRASAGAPPPWRYSAADIYGNFVWIRSSAAGSAGYYFFVCHLQLESTLGSLAPDQAVTEDSAIGVMGDTGNASGSPQLHAEIHYPGSATFSCKPCRPRLNLTAINPFASLAGARLRE